MITDRERDFLQSVKWLEPEAYGVPMIEQLDKRSEERWSLGKLYITAERLENRGYVTARFGDATPERGNRPKKFWTLTEKGRKAIE